MAKFAEMQTQHIKLIVTALAIMVGWRLFDGVAGDWYLTQLQYVGHDPIQLTMLCLVKFVVVLAAGALAFAIPLAAAAEKIKKTEFLVTMAFWVYASSLLVQPATVQPTSSFRPPRQLS